MIQSLDVHLWGRRVGTLVAYEQHHVTKTCFYFDEPYVRDGYDLAPLRASLKGAAARNGLPIYADEGKLFGGLPSFIADSLPDHWGNKVFGEWAKAHHIKARDLSPLDRLAYIGRRGMGALEFLPPVAEDMEAPFQVEIESLYSLAQQALREAEDFKASVSPDLMIESLFRVGTSAGGRCPKAVVNVNMETGECYSGQVAAPLPGFTPMLVKLDEHNGIPATRIEYSYYLMAEDAGLPMTHSWLLRGKEADHFLTTRFDRRGDEKIHVQTLAAMSPNASSYEDLFDTACRLAIVPSELKRLFVQMVMNVLAGNVDDHSKNFSFLMGKDGAWHASPAYDFTFTVDPSAPAYVNRHSLTVNGRDSDIGRRDLLEVAARYGVKGASALVDRLAAVVRGYASYAKQAEVGSKWTERITEETALRLEAL
ncbi:MAG: type II toxin-antitoxin system HipA family toxin [Prevotellaceae bacterium]|nr:type II toxin-antitoxin system HipA family toxin [Prevotellaceae bacterium]